MAGFKTLKSQVPETGNWKQWYYISLNAEVLLFSCPVGWKSYCCLIPETNSSASCQEVGISIAYPGIASSVTY
jgi:hypothetical protein